MLRTIEKTLASKNDNEELSLPDQETAEAIKGDLNKHREHEVHRTGHVDNSMQAPPNLRQAANQVARSPKVISGCLEDEVSKE